MKDVTGTELQIGDPVVYVKPGHYKDLGRGTVTGFTPKMVRILPKGYDMNSKHRTRQFASQVAKVAGI